MSLSPEQLKLEIYRQKEVKLDHQRKLPHLYGQKFYSWQREFFEELNKKCFLTAANQIGKSTIQIRRKIQWCTEPRLWPVLWPSLTTKLGWYLYPTREVATYEWETKWKPLMPKDDYKDHPQYGWEEIMVNKRIEGIRFRSGFLLLFKVYAQDTSNLQTGTCAFVACDEELPFQHFHELMMRLNAQNGYFSLVFTAVEGQEEWRQTMEPAEEEEELFKGSWKKQISLYDCLRYEDGSSSHWTEDRIAEIMANCGTEAEIQRRVFGKFVLSAGRRFEAFETTRHMKDGHPIPASWKWYAGIDPGSGGEEGDPAAIVFIAASPDHTTGRVARTWRGDGVLTTSSDIIMKYLEMRTEILGERSLELTVYDFADKDLHTIASRMGEGFAKADKGHSRGDGIVNTLFKNNMLYLYRDGGDNGKLAAELSSLKVGQKRKMDHLSDALRYTCVAIPWDFRVVNPVTAKQLEPPPEEVLTQDDLRRGRRYAEEPINEIDAELAEWSSYLEG